MHLKVKLKVFKGLLRRLIRGQYPRFLAIVILRCKTRSPQSFSEKILYKMAWDRRPLLTLVADKIAVRDYVAAQIGSSYLSHLIAIDPSDEEFANLILPENFVIKPNHASGAAIIVWSQLPKLPAALKVNHEFEKFFIPPEQFNKKDALPIIKWWLSRDYSNCSKIGYPEWAYQNITRRYYIEELLFHESELPRDYRFFMVGGQCEFISTDTPGLNQIIRNIYDADWNLIKVKFKYPNGPSENRPSKLDEMLSIAEELSSRFDHVRVDLYLVGSRIVFGELTNYHSGGIQIFEPTFYNFELGKNWNPSNFYGPSVN